MEHNLENTIALLSRTPAVFTALLHDLPETWTFRNEGDDSWNAFEIVRHLVHAEVNNWIARAKTLLKYGESQAFEPFVRRAKEREIEKESLQQLLAEFARLRSQNLDELRAMNLQPADLARRGLHPALGVVTLSELLATWAAHDLTHLHQISRVMAYQYRETVGPFSRFLGVLKCEGHSSAG
jgi:hypothetical protein